MRSFLFLAFLAHLDYLMVLGGVNLCVGVYLYVTSTCRASALIYSLSTIARVNVTFDQPTGSIFCHVTLFNFLLFSLDLWTYEVIENECTKECKMSGKFPWFPGKLALKLIEVAGVTSCCWPMQSLSHDIILSAGVVPVLMNFKEMNALP